MKARTTTKGNVVTDDNATKKSAKPAAKQPNTKKSSGGMYSCEATFCGQQVQDDGTVAGGRGKKSSAATVKTNKSGMTMAAASFNGTAIPQDGCGIQGYKEQMCSVMQTKCTKAIGGSLVMMVQGDV